MKDRHFNNKNPSVFENLYSWPLKESWNYLFPSLHETSADVAAKLSGK